MLIIGKPFETIMNSFTVILVITTGFFLIVTLVEGRIDKESSQDLATDETTIIFRPLFVYKMQQAKKLERQKIREWQRLHPNENYYYNQQRYRNTIQGFIFK